MIKTLLSTAAIVIGLAAIPAVAAPTAAPMAAHHHHHHHHALPGAAPGVPEWLEPGMSPDYARAVWQAYYFEHDPRNLHAFGDRLHEMRLHRAGDALHRRAAAVEHRLHQQPYAV